MGAWPLLVLLLLGQDTPTPSPVPPPTGESFVVDAVVGARERPTPPPAVPPRVLKLGAYGPAVPADPATRMGPAVPRFETEVEVRGRAEDSAALTLKLAWWLRDFDGTRGPVSGAGRAPTLAEMREFRPHPADSLDVGALIGWLVGKINERTK